MHATSRLLTIALLACVVGPLSAQEAPPPAAETAPPPPADPDAVVLHLMDGSTIHGKLTIGEIEIETAFGMLSVPVTAIVSFTPGLGSHPDVARDITAL